MTSPGRPLQMDVPPHCLQIWAPGKSPAQGHRVWSKLHPIPCCPALACCIDTTWISVGNTGALHLGLRLLIRSLPDMGPQLPHLENGSVIPTQALSNSAFRSKESAACELLWKWWRSFLSGRLVGYGGGTWVLVEAQAWHQESGDLGLNLDPPNYWLGASSMFSSMDWG